jgi:ankyrin repeat protein
MLAYLADWRNDRLLKSLLVCKSDAEGVSCVRKLLNAGMSMSSLLAAADSNGWTILQLAALHNHTATVIALRDIAQASTHSQSQENASNNSRATFRAACENDAVCGMTPLLLALASGHEALACLLLDAGVAISPTAARSRNCVYLLCRTDMPEALRCLERNHGAAEVIGLAAAPDTSGYNALHAAVLAGHVTLADALLSTGSVGEAGRACLGARSKDESNVCV